MDKKYFEAIAGCDGGNDVVALTLWQDNTVLKKSVSYDNFCDTLLQSRRRNTQTKLGLFPKEVLSIVLGEDEKRIFCFLPSSIRFLGYRRHGETDMQGFMVPYPGLILEISWKSQSARPLSAWCVNSTVDWPTAETLLYRFPFGNVADNGSICMGGNSVKLQGNESLAEVVASCEDLFFNTPYNGDYYHVGNKVNSTDSLSDVLSSLHGKEAFPDELLVLDGRNVQSVI